jgi:hypothetical protein
VLVAQALLLANIAPVWWVSWSCGGGFVGNNEFGWPCTYLWTPLTAEQKTAVWQQGPRRTWLLPVGDFLCAPQDVEGYQPGSLTVNVVCAFFGIVLTGVFVEYFQRIWTVRPDLTVRGMLGVVTAAAILTALSRCDRAVALISRSDLGGSPGSVSLLWSVSFQVAVAAIGIIATLSVVLLSRMASNAR